MKNKMKLWASLCLLFPCLLVAQSPLSGFMKGAGEGAVSVSYSQEAYDKVFLVPVEVDGVPVFNDVTTTSISLYAEVGITDRLNVVLNLPYVESVGNASEATLINNGFENERSGIQDVKLYAKYNFKTFNAGTNTIDLIGAIGVETPLGNYRADEGLQSIIAIGNESPSLNMMGIATFKTASGFFATGQAGYSFRGNSSPNALLTELKVGYAAANYYVDAYVANQLSDKDGVDILGEGFEGFFPEVRVNYTRIGLNAFVPFTQEFGVAAGANAFIAGRNLGKATGFYGALVYSF